MNVFVFVLLLQGNLLNYLFLKIYKQLFKKIWKLIYNDLEVIFADDPKQQQAYCNVNMSYLLMECGLSLQACT